VSSAKNRRAKKRGKRDVRRTDRLAISVMPQFHRTLPPALLSNNPDCCALQLPIMAMSPHGAHRVACSDVAIIGDIVTLPAILFWKNAAGPYAVVDSLLRLQLY
jgi:hypothetical protein